jgi:hypothetical protein
MNKMRNPMSKMRNISLLCALLSAAGADDEYYLSPKPGPRLSADGIYFQLNFPPVIVAKLREFIAGVEGKNKRPCDIYAIEASGERLTSLDQEFSKTVEAMVPFITLPWEEMQTRLQETNVVRVYKTLLKFHNDKVQLPANGVSAFCVKNILNYFFDQAAECPPASCGTVSFLMRKIKFGQEAAETIDDYIFHLDRIIQAPLHFHHSNEN